MKKRNYTLVEVMIVAVMILIIVAVFTIICLTINGCQVVREKGLKNVGTEIWEGPKK